MLQQGSSDNDFLLYLPIEDIRDNLPGRMVAFDIHKMKQRAPGFIGAVNSIMKEGYNVDYISDALLPLQARRMDGYRLWEGRLIQPWSCRKQS